MAQARKRVDEWVGAGESRVRWLCAHWQLATWMGSPCVRSGMDRVKDLHGFGIARGERLFGRFACGCTDLEEEPGEVEEALTASCSPQKGRGGLTQSLTDGGEFACCLIECKKLVFAGGKGGG